MADSLSKLARWAAGMLDVLRLMLEAGFDPDAEIQRLKRSYASRRNTADLRVELRRATPPPGTLPALEIDGTMKRDPRRE